MNRNSPEISDEQFQANRFDIVSRLADDLAHEIKNPLNAIVINLEVLKVRIARGDADAAAGRAAVIEQEVRRLHELVDRILLLVRPERDEGSNLSVDTALDELAPLLEAQARLARNEFAVQCMPAIFVAVRRDVLKFALLNLLMATHDRLGEGGGRLSLECTVQGERVGFDVVATALDGASLVEGAEEGMRRAATTVELLLRDAGAVVTVHDSRITVTIPRAAPV
ncbi:MAG TPA: histidine kinase dimerization/phospho-acceptor domain-containing protein [Longimicrobiales bacterium]|nr:histidine kinase dimerization/phospho-acceptor domain-containing protein [Longimicrobiales bacterium]